MKQTETFIAGKVCVAKNVRLLETGCVSGCANVRSLGDMLTVFQEVSNVRSLGDGLTVFQDVPDVRSL